MIIVEPPPPPVTRRPTIRQPISRYAERALDDAIAAILGAPAGQQRDTLNRECFAIGGLVAGGVLPSAVALDDDEPTRH